MRREDLIATLLGLALGLAAGLYYSWILNPVEYVDTAPDSLRQDFRADYLALIASAYESSGDLVRARARLALFSDADAAALASLAQQRMASGGPGSETDALAALAAALQREPARTTAPPEPTATEPRSTSTPTASPSPRPSITPTITQGEPFELESREQICDPQLGEPLIQVVTMDAEGEPVPGIEILVLWDAGQDRFFTGLKPELGLGYGDFTMMPGESYTLQLPESAQLVTGLGSYECDTEQGETIQGSWLLRFAQPAAPEE